MIDIHKISLTDQNVWRMISDGNVKGCFQIESHLGRTWCQKVKPENIEQLSDLIAIIRPGVLQFIYDEKSMAQHYVDRKHGIESADPIHPALTDILKDTHQVLIYQEQIIRIAQEIAGFSEAEGDILRKCISGDSLMMTDRGPLPIKNMVGKTTRIMSHDGNGQLKYYDVKNVWSNGIKKVYCVKTSNGMSIKATENHQFYTQRGWVQLKDLKLDDFVMHPIKYTYKGKNKKWLNHDVARLIGYFIAEGCYTEKTRPKITNTDQCIVDDIKNIILNNFGEDCYTQHGIDIHFRSNLKDMIIKNFKPCRSSLKTVPDFIINSTKGVMKHFIASYFNGDGTVLVKSGNISLCSVSEKMMQQFQMMLFRFGIISNVSKKQISYTYKSEHQNEFAYELNISDRRYIAVFMKQFGDLIINSKKCKINQILSQKYQPSFSGSTIPSEIIKSITSFLTLNHILPSDLVSGSIYTSDITYDNAQLLNNYIGSDFLQSIIDSEYKFTKLKSIEYTGEEEVFDFELESEPHCGFINGVLVHNSVGKKDAKLLNSLEESFVNGCVNTGLVDRDSASLIFENIRKSSRYLFNKCLDPSSIVQTPDGYKLLSEIQIGDYVLAPLNENEDHYVEVIDTIDNGDKEVYEIELDDGNSITCTLDHKFLCSDGKKHKLLEIIQQDLSIMVYKQ